jgi:AraC-like DNA-binding protein
MLPIEFATRNLAPADRAGAWQRWFWPIFDITPGADADKRFLARIRVWDVGGLIVSHVVAPSVTMARTRTHLAKAPVDHWVLSCCLKGVASTRTDRAHLVAPAHLPFLWSLGEVSHGERTDVDKIQILLPRDMFPAIRTQLDAMRGTVLDWPSAMLLGEYMRALPRWLPNLPADAMPRMATSLQNMISACLAPEQAKALPAEADVRGFARDRIRRVIQAHLRSPSLGPEMLCRMAGISRSGLYRLFAYDGGIVHYIQRQRLLHAHAVLSDPLSRETILTVSENLCFSDASSFSRAFRREFGCSPSDVRAGTSAGSPPPAAGAAREPAQTRGFADLLHA